MKKIFLLLFIAQGIWFGVAGQPGVGIGTNTPNSNAILELKSFNQGLLFPRTSTTSRNAIPSTRGLFVYDTTLNQVYYHNGISWQQVTTGSPPPNHWSVAGTHIYNNNTGNVGIGFSIPPYKLSVEGDVYIHSGEPTLRLSGGAGVNFARVRFTLTDDDTDFNITQGLSNLWISRSMGAFGFVNDLVVSENGYIGIGESNPQVRLNVNAGSDVGGATGGYLQLGITAGVNIGIDNNEIQARSDSAASTLYLNNNGGAILIGSGSPAAGYSLSVNGKAICEELKIQASSNWPDYVFEENYSLRSLDDLRSFIQVHKHLPNIPDAKTVEANGIEVGEMQKRMMEKVEELTLYILQLEEKLTALEQRISQDGQ